MHNAGSAKLFLRRLLAIAWKRTRAGSAARVGWFIAAAHNHMARISLEEMQKQNADI